MRGALWSMAALDEADATGRTGVVEDSVSRVWRRPRPGVGTIGVSSLIGGSFSAPTGFRDETGVRFQVGEG